MTVSTDFWDFAKSFLIMLPDCRWYYEHNTSYQVPLPRPAVGQPRRRIFFIDAPLLLYEFGNPLPGSVYPKTFLQLVNSIAKKIEYLLIDDLSEGVLLVFDDHPPLAKQHSAIRDPTEATPVTPMELVNDLGGSEPYRRIEAWVRWSQQPDRRVEGLRETSLGSSNLAEKPFDFKLPAWKPPKNPSPEQAAQLADGTLKPPFLDDYLKNADFKKMLYQKILETLGGRVKIPLWKDPATNRQHRKWVVLLGTNFAATLYPNGVVDKVNDELKPVFREADTVIGHFMRLFMGRFDLVIESTDGDCTMCALLAMDDCVRKRGEQIGDVAFAGRLYHVRHRWKNTRTQLIDVCEMWRAVHNTFAALAAVERVQLENPVGTFVALSMMLTNDYVTHYPQIGGSRLYKGVIRNAALIFASGDLVHNSWKEPDNFKLNWETFKRLSAAVWTEIASIELDITKPDAAIAQLEHGDTMASKHGFGMSLVRRTFANLTWCMRYFNTAGLAGVPHPNEFATTATGASIFGYTKQSSEMDRYGRHSVVFAQTVAIDSLI